METNAGLIRLLQAGYPQWRIGLRRQGHFQGTRTQIEQALVLARKAGSRQLEADSLRILPGERGGPP